MSQTTHPPLLPVMTPFVHRALHVLRSHLGRRKCSMRGRNPRKLVSLRIAWSEDELHRWEREEGAHATGIDTYTHWCSYVFGVDDAFTLL